MLVRGCFANLVLCTNEAGLVGAEVLAGEAMPLGVTAVTGVGAKLLDRPIKTSAARAHSGPDFYVNSRGDALPATAYRNMDSARAPAVMETGTDRLSYFGFTRYETAESARDGLQIFYAPGDPLSWGDARLRGQFDTLQLFRKDGSVNARVPYERGDSGLVLEPITRSYPDYGKGGQFQLLPADKGTVIRFERLDLIPEAVK